MSRDHRKLRAFELADALVIEVYKMTRSFPKDELFGLTAQVRRAAVSVAANIVEGSARGSEKEYLQFLQIALGSLRETGYFIDLSARLGYIPRERAAELSAKYEETARVLSGLVRSLKGNL
ncbi:MAG TPA: four helix bundle protein [Planctomycetota bacterium]|jgi:four helix bundle protein